ncbi:methyl-accepting chemotaxis protein, partial [bacterium]|nr:methyl-accepting chemotaxis protein [bacterium]
MNSDAKSIGMVSRIKVLQKILLGFLVVLSLIAFLGVQFVRYVGVIGQQLDQVMDTGRDAMDTAQLAQLSERMDRVVLSYVVSQTELALVAAKDQLTEFGKALGELDGLTERGADQAQIVAIQKAAKDYKAAFEHVVAAVGKRREGMGQTYLAGAQLNTTAMAVVDVALAAAEANVPQTALRLQQALQATRMSAARYLSTYDPNDASAAQSELVKL